MKYVASKNQKAFMADLKPVYRVATKESAEWGRFIPIGNQFLVQQMAESIGLF
jgi:hypothetical protein